MTLEMEKVHFIVKNLFPITNNLKSVTSFKVINDITLDIPLSV